MDTFVEQYSWLSDLLVETTLRGSLEMPYHLVISANRIRGQWFSFSKAAVCHLPYILESNLHPFCSFRGLKNQMRITIACGLDSRLRAGSRKNDRAAVHAIRTMQYNTILYLEKTWRLHHQFQEIVLSWVQWISFVMPHTRWSLSCVSATVKYCFQLQKLQRLCGFPSPLRTK